MIPDRAETVQPDRQDMYSVPSTTTLQISTVLSPQRDPITIQ
jgi:hypothetical protein